MLKKAAYLILILLALAGGAIYIIEREPRIQNYLCKVVQEELLKNNIKAHVKEVRLLTPRVKLEQISFELEEFSCQAPALQVHASLLLLAFYQTLSLSLYSNEVTLTVVSPTGEHCWLPALKS